MLVLVVVEDDRLEEDTSVELATIGGVYIGGRLGELSNSALDVEALGDVDVETKTDVVTGITTRSLEVDGVEEGATIAEEELEVLVPEFVVAELLLVDSPIEVLLAIIGRDVDNKIELDTGTNDDGGM